MKNSLILIVFRAQSDTSLDANSSTSLSCSVFWNKEISSSYFLFEGALFLINNFKGKKVFEHEHSFLSPVSAILFLYIRALLCQNQQKQNRWQTKANVSQDQSMMTDLKIFPADTHRDKTQFFGTPVSKQGIAYNMSQNCFLGIWWRIYITVACIYRWVPFYPNTLDPNSWKNSKNHGACVPIFPVLNLTLNSKFTWIKRFLLGFVCSDLAGNTCTTRS